MFCKGRLVSSRCRVIYPFASLQRQKLPFSRIIDRQEHATSKNKHDSYGVIYNPPNYTIENEELDNSVRCCITGYKQENHASYTKDTGMSICFLGTSSGVPTRYRSTSATLLRYVHKSLVLFLVWLLFSFR